LFASAGIEKRHTFHLHPLCRNLSLRMVEGTPEEKKETPEHGKVS